MIAERCPIAVNDGEGAQRRPRPCSHCWRSPLAPSSPGVITPMETLEPHSADWQTVDAVLPDIYRRHEAHAWPGDKPTKD